MSYNYRPATVDDLDEIVNIMDLVIEGTYTSLPR